MDERRSPAQNAGYRRQAGKGVDEIDACIARTGIMADEIARSDAGVSGAQNLYHVAYGDGFSAQHLLNGVIWR